MPAFTLHNALNHHRPLKTGIVGDLSHRLFQSTFNEVSPKLLFARELEFFKNFPADGLLLLLNSDNKHPVV
jgi:hypothetical protein